MFSLNKKREPSENYFPVHNRIFDLGLCAEEIAIYLYLVRCEDKKTFTCYPSYATIGESIGRSANTVSKYINNLKLLFINYIKNKFEKKYVKFLTDKGSKVIEYATLESFGDTE